MRYGFEEYGIGFIEEECYEINFNSRQTRKIRHFIVVMLVCRYFACKYRNLYDVGVFIFFYRLCKLAYS